MKRTYPAIFIFSIFSLSAMDNNNSRKPEWVMNLESSVAKNTAAIKNLSDQLATIQALLTPTKQPKMPEIKPSTPPEIKPAINQGIQLTSWWPSPTLMFNSFTNMNFNLKYDDVAKNYKVTYSRFELDFKQYKKTIQDAYNSIDSKGLEQITPTDPALDLYGYINYIKSNSTDLQSAYGKNLQEIVKHDAAIMDAFYKENMQELSKLLDERNAKLAGNANLRIAAGQVRRLALIRGQDLLKNLRDNK